MGFATCEYTGDTATSGSVRIHIPETINATTESDDSTWLKPKGVFERVCKKCGSPFDSLKRKAQVCLECKQEKKQVATGR
jgi:predicted Zn-ribbon and HTH transcriptional regulator